MKKLIALMMCIVLNVGCAVSSPKGPNAGHGFSSALAGLAHLVLSPVQIAAGVLEGISAVPYYLSTNIHEINRGMIEAQAAITLDDTYESAYGTRLSQVPEDGETGEVFRRMKHATQYFQKVLRQYGVQDADRYILTSIDTANKDGYTLFAVVYRPKETIRVFDKYNGTSVRKFHRSDRLFYEPFATDVNGNPLDTIIDWAGLPRKIIGNQKAQALLITMAANAVVEGRINDDYWDAEKKWIGGDFLAITERKMQGVKEKMNI